MNKNAKKGGNATVATAKVEKMAKAVVKETAQVEGPEASVAEVPAPVVPHIEGAFEVGSRIETSLISPLKVFGKKEATGTPAQMKPCAAIILEKLAIAGPTGTNLIRVKKPGSTRIFYTTEENLIVGEGAPAAVVTAPVVKEEKPAPVAKAPKAAKVEAAAEVAEMAE
jgi:hypothetical protein